MGFDFLVLIIAAVGIKRQVKEGVQYAVKTSIQESANLAFNYGTVIAVKKNVKESIEFIAKTARDEVKKLLNDPQVKQDIKEALEYSGKKLRK
ncbi:MAG: hypothetical protein QME06_02370 [Desulfobacterales bacterium]|nr:hypothetical protein [Desulfobacterales bacterium]